MENATKRVSGRVILTGLLIALPTGSLFAETTITTGGGSGGLFPTLYCDGSSTSSGVLTQATATPISCQNSAKLCIANSGGYACNLTLTAGNFNTSNNPTPSSCGTVTSASNFNVAFTTTGNFESLYEPDSSCAGGPPPPSGVTPPANFSWSSDSANSGTLSWSTPAADSSDPTAQFNYTVTFQPPNVPSAPQFSPCDNGVTISGLSPTTTYSVTVTATEVDAASKKATSTPPYSFTTPAAGGGVPAYQSSFYKSFFGSADPYGVNAPPNHFGVFVQNPNTEKTDLVDVDARDASVGNNVYADFQQIKQAGFSVIRAYQEPAPDWVTIINQAKKNGLSVIYQVALCQDDPTTKNCMSNGAPTGVLFTQLLASEIETLKSVITQVTPAVFQSTVKMVLVGNEDLYTVPSTDDTTNVSDLVDAMNQISSTLNSASISPVPIITTSIQADVMMGNSLESRTTLTEGIKSVNSANSNPPVLAINVYPAQWGVPANCAANGSCTTSLCTEIPNSCDPSAGPKTGAEADKHTLSYYVQQLQSYYGLAIMIAETGWPTNNSVMPAGQGYVFYGPFTQADSQTYWQSVYGFSSSQNVPILDFEMYDQPGKVPNSTTNPENFYGVMTSTNDLKSTEQLPPPNTLTPSSNQIFDSSKLAYITFTGMNGNGCDPVNSPDSCGCVAQDGIYLPPCTNIYPDKVHITVNRNSTNIIDDDFSPYIDSLAKSIVWPQILVQQSDVVTVHSYANGPVVAKGCTGTVQITPNLATPMPNWQVNGVWYLGNAYIGAAFSKTATDGKYDGFTPAPKYTATTVCGKLSSTPNVNTSAANVWGLDSLATNMPKTFNVGAISATYGSGTACGGSMAQGTTSVPIPVDSNTAVLTVTPSDGPVTLTANTGGCNCTASATLDSSGVWGSVSGDTGCANWTNQDGATPPKIWITPAS
ncbi:MAG: hypothetical protein A3E84_04555 [Gammaproteobacteria bacterium RIFCSPHIGHO2_12_FULL_42_13]|nr:MAG: hypothetical protein A3E84_04555 [Gammaproteobacteria bacterium RIFCSPHIGHO2_12_FULL_42_13]